jgi:hypothetical protein
VTYLLAALLLVAALFWRRRRRLLLAAGAALLMATIGWRIKIATGRSLTMTNSDGGSRWLGRLVDEGDLAVPGAWLLARLGLVRDPEASQVPAALAQAYRELRDAHGSTPSPVLPTYLGLESPEHSDIVVVEAAHARGALIFLHGFAGNFSLQCQLVVQPDLVTFCPSLGWRGDWWTAGGARTLDKTLALVRRRGFGRVYLAGLSNGAAGAARLAPRLRGSLRGLILISGGSRDAAPPGVPVLVLQGRRDQMAGPELARGYADRTAAEYVDLPGGHFAFLLRNQEARRAIHEWLLRH